MINLPLPIYRVCRRGKKQEHDCCGVTDLQLMWCRAGDLSGLAGVAAGLSLLEREKHDALHLGRGRGFAGPELELARALLNEHLDALDDGDAAEAGLLEEGGIEGVVDEFEDQLRLPLTVFEREWMGMAGHAAGGAVDEGVEFDGRDLIPGDGLDAGFGGQGFGFRGVAAPEMDFRALVGKGIDGRAGCAARAEDEDARAFEGEALFERADDAGGVGVETLEFPVLAEEDGVASPDAGGEGVDVGEVGQDLDLEGHGDAETAEG